jgi:hypothetical protein
MWQAAIAIGLAAGIFGGFFGVGGGLIVVPLLILWLKVDTKMAVGTSLAVIVPTAIMAAWRHHQLGNVDWRLVAWMMIGSVAGAYAGASLTLYVGGEWIRRSFAVVLVATAARMLWK